MFERSSAVKFLNDSMPWATIMMAVLVGIAAVAGAVVVIVHPESLQFQQYLDILKNFAIAVGIVGVGRGIASYGKQTTSAALLGDATLVQPPAAPASGGTQALTGLVTSYDPYADVAWAEAAPPPQPQTPAAIGNGAPQEI
jgi:hypothetical protein